MRHADQPAIGRGFPLTTTAEEAAGYEIIRDTVDWLRAKGIKLWEKPLPREVYAARQQRGENYGLLVGSELATAVWLSLGGMRVVGLESVLGNIREKSGR